MRYWTPIAVLLAVVSAGALSAYCERRGEDIGFALEFVLSTAAQIGCGIWSGLSIHSRRVRASVLLGSTVGFLVAKFAVNRELIFPGDVHALIGTWLLYGGAEALLVFIGLELLCVQAVRISSSGSSTEDAKSAPAVVQFSLRGTLLATAAIAILFATHRWLDEPDQFVNITPAIYVMNCLAAAMGLMVTWLVLGRRFLLLRIVCNSALVAAIFWLMEWAGFEGADVLITPLITFFVCAILLMPFRLAGYRIIRRLARPKVVPHGSH